MPRRVLPLPIVICLSMTIGWSQPVAPSTEAPLAPDAAEPSAAAGVLDVSQAQLWHDLGVPEIAISIYSERLERTAGLGEAERLALTLRLADAQLDNGDFAGAEATLNTIQGPKSSGWNLRAGLVAAYQGRPAATSHAADVNSAALSNQEAGWYEFLLGMLLERDGNIERAEEQYRLALDLSTVDAQRARFQLARESARLALGRLPADQLPGLRDRARQFQGSPTGIEFAHRYAIGLANLGRSGEALTYLAQLLSELPPTGSVWSDRFRLLTRLIAGPGSDAGTNATRELLERGTDPSLQRIALQLFAREAQPAALRGLLDSLLGAPGGDHPIRDDLLAMRAGLALGSGTAAGYMQAEDDVAELLERFPASPWRAQALVARAGAEWGQQRYLRAAESAEAARVALGPGVARARLGVVRAEALYRAESFRDAADAYALALAENPADIPRSELIFQRIQAEIAASSLVDDVEISRVAGVMDSLAADPAFSLLDRWRAEWNLARSLMVAGRPEAALARVERLLATEPTAANRVGIDPALTLRMQWLQARLALDARAPEDTVRLTQSLVGLGASPGVDEQTFSEIRSQTSLILAQAHFDSGNEEEAIRVLTTLRNDFPRSNAAAQSYLIHAGYRMRTDTDTPGAITFLNQLVERFPETPYAPEALYRAAELEILRGQRESYEQAHRRLEDLVRQYPDSEFVIHARLLQGDVLRLLGDFAAARGVFEEILSNPTLASQPDAIVAELRLADTLRAQSQGSGPFFEQAASRYESVFLNVAAPADVQMEAGYKLGTLFANDFRRAERYWVDAITLATRDSGYLASLGPGGREYLELSISDLANSYESRGSPVQARNIRQIGERLGLPSTGASQPTAGP